MLAKSAKGGRAVTDITDDKGTMRQQERLVRQMAARPMCTGKSPVLNSVHHIFCYFGFNPKQTWAFGVCGSAVQL